MIIFLKVKRTCTSVSIWRSRLLFRGWSSVSGVDFSGCRFSTASFDAQVEEIQHKHADLMWDRETVISVSHTLLFWELLTQIWKLPYTLCVYKYPIGILTAAHTRTIILMCAHLQHTCSTVRGLSLRLSFFSLLDKLRENTHVLPWGICQKWFGSCTKCQNIMESGMWPCVCASLPESNLPSL